MSSWRTGLGWAAARRRARWRPGGQRGRQTPPSWHAETMTGSQRKPSSAGFSAPGKYVTSVGSRRRKSGGCFDKGWPLAHTRARCDSKPVQCRGCMAGWTPLTPSSVASICWSARATGIRTPDGQGDDAKRRRVPCGTLLVGLKLKLRQAITCRNPAGTSCPSCRPRT